MFKLAALSKDKYSKAYDIVTYLLSMGGLVAGSGVIV